jgi:hypothetical protein
MGRSIPKETKVDVTPRVMFSENQQRFIFSDDIIVVLYSNMGEGKTFAGVWGMVRHAQRNKQLIRCAIIRDTHENIKTSTVPSIKKALDFVRPGLYTFKNDYKQLIINTDPPVLADLFGIDDDAALSKLQGPEYALIWLEEPAPIIDRKNAGLPESVFNAALSRCARQDESIIPRLQITMNPADQDHWTYVRLIDAPRILDPECPLVTKSVFRLIPGENKHLSMLARQTTSVAYKGDVGLEQRYVKGLFAEVYRGVKVTPGYNEDIHRLKFPVEPARGLVGFRFWDGWHSPSCLMGQITHTGRLIFIDSIHLENADTISLIDFKVAPLLASPRWRNQCYGWRDIGDFSMRIPDQSNRNQSASRVIEEKLKTYFEPGPSRWEIMKNGLRHAFTRNDIRGRPAIQLNPEERILHKALNGDWHYKKDNSGNIASSIPEKNESSHIGDAFANGVCVLIPEMNKDVDIQKLKKVYSDARSRAESYGGATVETGIVGIS